MSKILFINACVRENSRTLELAKRLLEKLPDETEILELYDMELYPLDIKGIEARIKASHNKDFSDSIF